MVYRYSKAPTQRQLRVAENIKHIISEIFTRNELSLPLLEKMFVTISEVRISPDLKLATIFIATIVQIDQDELVKLLNNAAPQVKKILSKNIGLRFTPEIRFAYDKSFDEGAKMEALIHTAKNS